MKNATSLLTATLRVAGIAMVLACLSPLGAQDRPYRRGDADSSGAVDFQNVVVTLRSLFEGANEIGCEDAADSNDDGGISIQDATLTLSYLFLCGEMTAAPGPELCGIDPTEDSFGC